MPARPLFLLPSSRRCRARQSKFRPSQARRSLCNSSIFSRMFLSLVVSQSLNGRQRVVNPIRMLTIPLELSGKMKRASAVRKLLIGMHIGVQSTYLFLSSTFNSRSRNLDLGCRRRMKFVPTDGMREFFSERVVYFIKTKLLPRFEFIVKGVGFAGHMENKIFLGKYRVSAVEIQAVGECVG